MDKLSTTILGLGAVGLGMVACYALSEGYNVKGSYKDATISFDKPNGASAAPAGNEPKNE